MADNLDVTPGTGKTVATDEIGAVNYQRVKLIHGADGVNDGDVSNLNGLPVRQKTDVLSTVSGSAAATGVVGSVQDVGARSFALQLTGTFVGTITIEQSNDNSNWITCGLADVNTSLIGSSGSFFTSVNSTGLLYGYVYGRYVRVRCSTYTSGTIVVTCLFYANDIVPTTVRAIGLIPSTTAIGLGKAEDAAHTSGDVGVMSLAVRQDTLATLSSASGDYEPLHLSPNGALYQTSVANTSGGATPFKLISAATTNATVVKSSPGQIYALQFSSNTTLRYLKIYNKSTAPTVGTDVPVLTFPISASSSAFPVLEISGGIEFSAGIALALTSGIADNDTGAVSAGEVIVNILYK